MAKYLNDTGLSYLWGKITTALGGKVDKVDGKGLSTEDYTTTEKTKLSNAPNITYGTTDLTAGTSSLDTGAFYFVYE